MKARRVDPKKVNSSTGDNDYYNYRSIRNAVFELLSENPYLSRREIIEVLRNKCGFVNINKQTISNYKQSFKRNNHRLGLPPEAHKRIFQWKDVDGDRDRALQGSWVKSKNRNGMLVFRHPYGSLHWYQNRSVSLYLKSKFKGMVGLAKVKQLFCIAFRLLMSEKLLLSHVEGYPCEAGRHMVFDVGVPMPRFRIDYYRKSHGLTVYSDVSHHTAVEFAESTPIWFRKLEEHIEEQAKLIKMFQAESEARREAYERGVSGGGGTV